MSGSTTHEERTTGIGWTINMNTYDRSPFEVYQKLIRIHLSLIFRLGSILQEAITATVTTPTDRGQSPAQTEQPQPPPTLADSAHREPHARQR